MLTKLNEEQIRMMDKVRNEFIGLLDKKINESDAINGVKFVYKTSGLKEPKIIILDSPLACQIFCNQVRDQVDDQVSDQVRNQARNQVENQVDDQVSDQVSDQVRNQVKDQVWIQVRNQVKDQVWIQVWIQVRNQVVNQVENQYYGISYDGLWLVGWLSFYSYFNKIGILKNAIFNEYEKYIKSGIFSSIYFDKIAILSKNPIRISRDEKNNMHSIEGYAIEWSDGYGQYYVNGVYFDYDLFNKCFIKKDITSKEIVNLKNTEQKACLIKYIGYDKIIKEFDAKVIDRHIHEIILTQEMLYKWKGTVNKKTNIVKLIDEVIDYNLDGNNLRVLKVQDHSVGKETFLGVPVEKQTETVKGAIAWTFGLTEKDYNPIIET